MPKLGTFVEAQRATFGPWLARRVTASGASKKRIAASLGDDSTQRLNRYIRTIDPEIPTPAVLAKLSEAIGVPWPIAFWRAGYLREVLAGIDRIGDALDANRGDRKMVLSAKAALVDFALRAFPRRDLGTSFPMLADSFDAQDLAVRFLDVLSFDEVFARGEPRRLHPMLTRAADALLDDVFPIAVRRYVAGEYVNAWADAYHDGIAQVARAGLLRDPSFPTAHMARLILDDLDAHPQKGA